MTPLRRKSELRDLRSPQMMGAFQEQVSKKRRGQQPYTDFSNQFTIGSNYNVHPSDAERLGLLVEVCFPGARPEALSNAPP